MKNRTMIDLMDEAIHQAQGELTDSELLDYVEWLLSKREGAK